jgi:hypothetical protein
MKKQILRSVFITLLLCCTVQWATAQDIEPVSVGKDRITYQIGTSDAYLRLLPAALPQYVELIRMPFDLFPAMSDPEIKAELISVLDNFDPAKAGRDEIKHFLQNLTHLILLDIDNVEKWKSDYGEPLERLCKDRRFADSASRVSSLLDDYIKHYLPTMQNL